MHVSLSILFPNTEDFFKNDNPNLKSLALLFSPKRESTQSNDWFLDMPSVNDTSCLDLNS